MASLAIEPPSRPETDVLADLVERYLQRHQPSGYRMVVNRKAVRRGETRWLVQVDVESDGKEVRADDCADRIVAANIDFDRDFPRYVRMMPIVPLAGEAL